ncbi:hypothetical protein EHS15_00745 [Leptospira idonii]|uniref:Cysteine-rich CWC family protein n=1 Tax=Leptospira idonii TaxID=1193500 RepID=A0A4R9M2Z6_9LEPT|nr:hypothetical protein EHS15_00745 [Leptospira idonii]
MVKHEEKFCPKCKNLFECKVGSIAICQCSKVALSEEERNYLSIQYDDCLCYQCMSLLTEEYKTLQLYKSLTWSF